MYNSHGRPPIGVPPAPPNNRLNELLEQVRAEFDGQATRAVDYEQQRMFAFIVPLPGAVDDMCNAARQPTAAAQDIHISEEPLSLRRKLF